VPDLTSRKLSESQLQTFDHDYVPAELADGISRAICAQFPAGRFSFLDVGGGRGFFADKILNSFPSATGTVLDNSELLLYQNEHDHRKKLVLASATQLSSSLKGKKFDVIFFNLSLHHFVDASYRKTRQLQRDALSQAKSVLAPGGAIVVTENLYDGMFGSELPGYLVYLLTSSRLLAPVVKRLGANTAGCGVCFLSTRGWRREFEMLRLAEMDFREVPQPAPPWLKVRLLLLTVRSRSRAFFWLS